MHHRTFDNVVSVRDDGLRRLLGSLDLGPNIKWYSEDNRAIDALLEDVSRASQRIVISIPDGKLEELSASRFESAIRAARMRGVEVWLKCFNWKELPDGLQGFGWQSNDAVFPLVVIDGTVCWYDALPSRGRFAAKDGIIPKTTMQVPLRIEGLATVSMIWSLAELDKRSSDGGNQTLAERRGTTADDKDGTAAYGLALYVQKHRKCSVCKAPMNLAEGHYSGKTFLRCSSCENTELLKREEVNHYICVSGARCPQCKKGINAKLSKYGLYIMCDGGHKLKPNQI